MTADAAMVLSDAAAETLAVFAGSLGHVADPNRAVPTVTLTGQPDLNATFVISSDCIGTDSTCVVPMTDDRAVTATFAALPFAAPAPERA
jgi:hypothetical protein